MKIQPAVSLWNFNFYQNSPELEIILGDLKKQNLGIELWNSWQGDQGLYHKSNWKRVKNALAGMPVSLHSEIGVNERDFHLEQIDAAAEFGAQILVVHADNLIYPAEKNLNIDLAIELVEYAASCGVTITLENGQLPILARAVKEIKGLKICLDTGHVYLVRETMKDFIEELQSYIKHVHLQEILSESERVLVGEQGIILDHYTPGTGGIPGEDWSLFFNSLKENQYQGMVVFEIQPRNPLLTALLSENFIKKYL